MPFKTVEEAVKKHPNLDKYSAKAQRAWLSAFNSAIEKNDEGSAFAISYSVANKVDSKKAYEEIVERVIARSLEKT